MNLDYLKIVDAEYDHGIWKGCEHCRFGVLDNGRFCNCVRIAAWQDLVKALNIPKRYQSVTVAKQIIDSGLIYGPVHTGKTYYAWSLIKRLWVDKYENSFLAQMQGRGCTICSGEGCDICERGFFKPRPFNFNLARNLLCYVSADAMAEQLWHAKSGEDAENFTEQYRTVEYLIIDELGQAMDTSHYAVKLSDIIYRIINYRYEQMLPTLGLTNWTPEFFQDYDARMFDKIAADGMHQFTTRFPRVP